MSQAINSVVLAGNLTRDPELKSLQSGTSLCQLRVANNRRAKINGEWTDRPGYFDVTVWGAQGENCAKYLSKGRGVLVAGELRWREWETQEGGKRQAVDINAREVQFLGGGQDRDDSTGFQSDVPADTTGLGGGASGGGYDDSDIPF